MELRDFYRVFAPFYDADYWGSFEREPFGLGSGQHIIRARAASTP